jgi:hypothetical protein
VSPVARDLQRLHGIYVTPPPVVGYVVRSVQALLQTKLGKSAGLADMSIRLLDPTAGPMNFVRAAWQAAIAAHQSGEGDVGDLVRAHLLPNFRGIELMAAAHAEGLVAMRRLLEEIGYVSRRGERLPAILADALEPPRELLSKPANVVIGNPPWRGHSSNRGAWVGELLHGYRLPDGREDEGYFRVDGRPLAERNPKWLQDDYVKFLRLAQWLIDQSGEGVGAFVLNHNFLDAPTFRGLRRSLLRTFDEIYALDLHGNSRKRERAPDGEPDGNIFPGVAQGAAILLLVKKPGLWRRVFRADLYGSRSHKLDALDRSDVVTTQWAEVAPRSPSYLFLIGDRQVEREYGRGLSLPEIFPLHTSGIVTGRDALATALDRATFERRLADLRDLPPEAAPSGLSPRRFEEMRRDTGWRRKLTGFLARPFDVRYLLCAGYLIDRPRQSVMGHMWSGTNLGLIVPRQCKEEPGAFVSRWVAGHKAVSAYDINSLFPLYLDCAPERPPNLAPDLRRRLGDLYGDEPEPEKILGYVYAVLYSPTYRLRYRDLLQRNFPRISFPSDPQLFASLAEVGRELIGLHLLRDPRLRQGRVRLVGDVRQPLQESRRRPYYVEAEQAVYLNETGLGFEGIEPAVWGYRIGGYRVLSQWLQARAGRVLSFDEHREFRWIAEALHLTREIESSIEDTASPLQRKS